MVKTRMEDPQMSLEWASPWNVILPSTTPPVGPERSRLSNIPTSSLRPHHWCTSRFTLVTCAGAHYLQGCCPDVPCCDRWRTTVSAAVHPCHWRPFSTQTPVLYFRRPDRPGCSTDLHWLLHFSGSQSPHLEHATTARHLCLIVDCI